jgi:hypothetical protein
VISLVRASFAFVLLAGARHFVHNRGASPAILSSKSVPVAASRPAPGPSPAAVPLAPSAIGDPHHVTVPAPAELTPDMINTTYYEWARREPEDALVSATRIDDPRFRRVAIQSALSGWARKDPSTLAETALAFPDGEEKTAALTKAFRAWMIQDPKIAGDWLQAHPGQVTIAESVFRTAGQ